MTEAGGMPPKQSPSSRSAAFGPSTGAQVAAAIDELAKINPELATRLARLTMVLAGESVRNRRLANSLTVALSSAGTSTHTQAKQRNTSRRTRRTAGPWDPFMVYEQEGEGELRRRLADLELEQLRDIIAEHGMDNDRLAMKWKDVNRVIDRIVSRVVDRAAKGDAFR